MVFFGKISYSIYMMHLFVLIAPIRFCDMGRGADGI